METPDRIKKSLRIHSLNHPSGCIGCAYRGDNASKIPNGCADKLFKDVREYIKQLEAQVPRWISVEERLPEVDKRYGEYEYSAELLVYDGLRRRTAYYCHTSGVWYDSRYEDDTFEVTHWMPLPQPPEEPA